jgi:peptide-methionine (S)-S-oxide reductase
MSLKTAVFGGGCFWCTEAVFDRLKGVESVESGYAGGSMDNPTYEQVSSGSTGHAEVIKIQYDPDLIKFEDLLNVFFATHDPTTLNQQGNDVGTQYRSAIFYSDAEQKEIAEKYIADLDNSGTFSHPIVTEVKPLENFYPAEKYHQQFYDNNKEYPYCTFVIDPKVAKLREKFAYLLK